MAFMEKTLPNPGCISKRQALALENALSLAQNDPRWLCDLEASGPVAQLEKAFAQASGTRFALAVSSGTAALFSALLATEAGPGDEVIVSSYSWPQSAAPVLFTGATPVFADIRHDTLNMDPASAASLVSSKTSAIMPVHLFGHTADMPELEKLANAADAFLISDAAHGLGAKLHGRPIGGWGDISCFSLGRGKLVSGGEGGVLTTNNEALYEKMVAMTQHPERLRRIKGPGPWLGGMGLNFRLHPLAAVLALADLETMEEKINRRRQVLDSFWDGATGLNYNETSRSKLQGINNKNVRSCAANCEESNPIQITSPASIPGEEAAPYGVPLTFIGASGREDMTLKAQEKGIPLRCGPVETPLHFRLHQEDSPQPPFHPSQLKGACPVSEKRCAQEELWVLSALDMDGVSPREAFRMGGNLFNGKDI